MNAERVCGSLLRTAGVGVGDADASGMWSVGVRMMVKDEGVCLRLSDFR